MSESRYIIGIDLGTSNSCLSYIDTEGLGPHDTPCVQILHVPQVTVPGEVDTLPVLPSAIYLPGEHELAEGSISLPWAKTPDAAVGAFARNQGASVPHRLVSSAKSWLCHQSVDRRGAILPWSAEPDDKRISPVEASTRILCHLRDAWKTVVAGRKKELRMENQDVVLTVPASFEAVARDLTVEAAREAGLERVVLLEEPQAAIYSWIATHGENWREHVNQGDLVLACDIGGGTTDFSLVRVEHEEGDLTLRRIAVGEHILLGGDNFDLALARHVEAAMGTRLDRWQLNVLWHACRTAKEQLLANRDDGPVPVVIPGRGSKVVGGTLRGEVHWKQLETILMEGYFPQVVPGEQREEIPRTGFKEVGLPYARETAITKHLARFLAVHGQALKARDEAPDGWGDIAHPTAVLFNGGVFKSAMLRERMGSMVSSWVEGEGGSPVRALDGEDLDLAVARGASWYGWVRRGNGIRIRGGTGRAYYIGVEASMPAVPGLPPPVHAVCVAPFGMEEGTQADLPEREFGLIVGQPAAFRFFSSSTRRDDQLGTTVDNPSGAGIEELDPVETILESESAPEGSILTVRIRSVVSEVGTLEVWAVAADGSESFRLEFRIRDAENGR